MANENDSALLQAAFPPSVPRFLRGLLEILESEHKRKVFKSLTHAGKALADFILKEFVSPVFPRTTYLTHSGAIVTIVRTGSKLCYAASTAPFKTIRTQNLSPDR